MTLQELGWNDHFDAAFTVYADKGMQPARVTREDRDRYSVLGVSGERIAQLAGKLRHEATTRSDLPAVGDWAALRDGDAALAIIAAVLPRTSAFVRKVAGETTVEQVVAANVQTVFLVAGLDDDFNLRRLERYLAAAWESGANPVIVLNKADLSDDLQQRTWEVEAIAPGVPVVAVSALEASGLETLAPWLKPGRTVAMLGSSGVGKSTLVNALLGEARQATGDVRSDDSRGRHTTTHRELIALSGGALLLDTPGMRELQLWGDEASLDEVYADIASLAQSCRFGDCRHDSEPGCAVREALERGALDIGRFESWRKLQRELKRLALRKDARGRATEVAKWKAIHKSMKHHPKLKQRGER